MRHIVITGASSGFGAALAHSFSAAGYKLTLIARNETRLRELGTKLSADWMVTDVLTSYETLVDDVVQKYGPIDGWVNNAGVGEFDRVVDQTTDVIEETMRLNAIAPMVMSRDCGRRMKRGGTIINVCSQAAKVPTPKSAVYAGSKAALLQFSNALRLELKPAGVHVLTVNPGPINTPFFDRADKTGRYEQSVRRIMLDPDQLAQRVVSAFEQSKREVNAPWWMDLGGKLYAMCPIWFERLAKRGFDKK
ncbi:MULTISPECIES: SDR family oxidoreductase [unclassified Exiguobacterium]|uniref:SDR family NAD(P)-dependent oxidoreductase n=1 Tax=unclassified Exiguobacterium TaxID=2644629 RepID=UPI0008C37E4F|nr:MULTISPECIES: SDR family oxidoreductase [unclassified Exiguobacterium]OGX80387.1 short-chain dehydrogenase [Exiguobacterium sp. SH31]